jgi:tripartite-type tricarboxylate transporter receptor subunit TctC
MTRALTRRRALAWTATAAAFAAAPALVRASGDLRVVVPYPAGGSPDNSARIASAEAARELGVSVIVENRPGASGLLGARAVSQGQADGSTLVYVSSGHVTLAAINPRFDLLKELRPVVRVSRRGSRSRRNPIGRSRRRPSTSAATVGGMCRSRSSGRRGPSPPARSP